MIAEPVFKASCGHCDGHVEFGADYVNREIPCPHCGELMMLWVPKPKPPPLKRSFIPKINPTAWPARSLTFVGMALLGLIFLAAAFGNPPGMDREQIMWIGFGVSVLGPVGYLFPALVAEERGHHQRLAILVLDIFAGWTVVGWVVALVWACTAVERGKA